MRPVYGAALLRRSRAGAGIALAAMFLLSAGLFAVLPVLKIMPTQSQSSAVMILRTVQPASDTVPVRKLLADTSEVTLPMEQPVEVKSVPLEQPRPKPRQYRRTKSAPVLPKAAPIAPVQQPAQAENAVTNTPSSSIPSGHAADKQLMQQDRGDVLAALLRAVNRHKKYPRQARRTGAEGTVHLRVSIGSTGRVTECRLEYASGQTVLDSATMRLGEKLVGLEVAPAGKAGFTVVIPVHYTLQNV